MNPVMQILNVNSVKSPKIGRSKTRRISGYVDSVPAGNSAKNEDLHAKVKHQLDFLRYHYDSQVQNIKPALKEEVRHFLKEKGITLVRTFNTEIEKLVLSFQDYRITTD